MNFRLITEYLPSFWSALLQTLKIAAISGFFALILGTGLAIVSLSRSKITRFIIGAYNGFMRSTPLLVQLYIVHYGLPSIGITLTSFQSAIIAFSLNTASYISEIVRGGISSIDKGQSEASKALGLSWYKMMSKVILPQVFGRIMPPLISQFSYLIKDTSLAAVLAIAELTYSAREVVSNTYRPIEAYSVPMLMYFAVFLMLRFASTIITNQQGKSRGKGRNEDARKTLFMRRKES